jgi:trigger factor
MEQTTLSTSPELHNEQVRFTIHERPKCIVEFNVEALAPVMKKARHLAVKRVAKEVSLPGFRKGKAPEELIEKNYKQAVEKEWQQEIANVALQECQKLAKVRLLHRDGKITYQMKSHSSNGALLLLFLEVEPRIPHVDPKLMHLKAVKRPDVNTDKIEETIRQVQLFFATWTNVEDRPVQLGDFVSLDVDLIENTPAVSLFSDTRFEVTEKSMSKWMFDLVFGKEVGAVSEGVSVPDDTASEEEKAELTAKKVRITIRSINTAVLPELNDDFVKKIGAATVDEMREKITALLNKQADEHVLEEQRKQVSHFLLHENPFELPVTLIEKETEFRFRQLWDDAGFQDYWKGLSADERQKMIRTVHEQSEKAVRMFYLCRQIASDAQLKIGAEDLPAPATTTLDLLLDMKKPQYQQKSPEIEHAEAYSRLILEKAEDFIIRNATSA